MYVPAYNALHSKTLVETSTGLPIGIDPESVAENIYDGVPPETETWKLPVFSPKQVTSTSEPF